MSDLEAAFNVVLYKDLLALCDLGAAFNMVLYMVFLANK